MSQNKPLLAPSDAENVRKRSTAGSSGHHGEPDQQQRFPRRLHSDLAVAETPSPDPGHHYCVYSPKALLAVPRGQSRDSRTSARSTPSQYAEEGWHEGTSKTTIRADNEVEAMREANNYKFGFRKWKGYVTEIPMENRSSVVKELHCDLTTVKPQAGSVITFGNIVYVFLFGWWVSLFYLLLCPLMFLTVCGAPYGKLCWKLTFYFIWPFGKSIQREFPNSGTIQEEEEVDTEDREELDRVKDSTPVSVSSPAPLEELTVPIEIPVPTCLPLQEKKPSDHWWRFSTMVWLMSGYPVLVVVHSLACIISWLLVFTIPVAKMNARTLSTVLLMPPEDIHIHTPKNLHGCETKVILCCYRAFNVYYYKYTLQGIHMFALNMLLMVLVTLIIGYMDRANVYTSPEVKFATAISSIIPLSYFIGLGIASLSAQSNFAVGAVVNATFGSITEMTFYITALLQGHSQGTKCYEEIVKAALTGTILGCILFIPGICMIIGGIKHREQRFNSRSAGVSSALLFISIGGVFAPTLFSKSYGNLICDECSSILGNTTSPFMCKDCHYDMTQASQPWVLSHIEPLVYTISVLLPTAYLIGLIFTLKTHSHIYDIHISDGQGGQGQAQGQYPKEGTSMTTNVKVTTDHLKTDNTSINDAVTTASTSHGTGHVVHWSRWRALGVLILATVLMAACADLTTENIQPILTHSTINQYFIGVTVLAMVPELPEMVNGIQFALQNNISLSLEVGSCIAVQVCMIQIPLLILFNSIYDVGFVLVFSDIHLWASIFSVIVVNYIFMDGKCDYFQGTALVVVYLILLALYFFAPSPRAC